MSLDLIGDVLAQSWRADPAAFASRITLGQWQAYRHLAAALAHVRRRIVAGGARIILAMPPRHGKSMTFSDLLPTWYLEAYPERQVILTSYGAALASRFAIRVRDRLQGGGTLTDTLVKATQTEIITSAGGGLLAAGVDGPITGSGADLGIIDDPHKDWRDAMSAARRQAVIDWYGSTFYTRLAPGASVLVIMTRWHHQDLVGWLTSESGERWEVIRLPAIAEAGDWLGREVGEALCPERYNVEDLARIRSAIANERIWAGLYQQRPSVEEGGIIRASWIGRWSQLPAMRRGDRVIQSWDCSMGGVSESASWQVGQVWLQRDDHYYLVDQVRGRWELPELLEQVRALRDAYPMTTHTLIERAAHGNAVLRKLTPELLNPIPVDPKRLGDKVTRLRGASPAFEQRRVFAPPDDGDSPWVGGWIEELTAFPNGGSDDQCDATSQAINWMDEAGGRGVWAVYRDRAAA